MLITIKHRLAKKYSIERDVLVVLIASTASYYIVTFFEFSERYYYWTSAWEQYQLDELIFILLFITLALTWFSVRRLQETRYVLANNLKMQEKLEHKNREISQLLAKNIAMMRRLVVIRENERQHLATELHDVFGQHLAAMDANLIAAQYTVESESKTYEILQSVLSSSHFLTELTRNKLRDLKPPSLKNLGLTGAIEELVEQWKLTFTEHYLSYHLDINDELISEDVALTLYRAIQEGLVNIVRHAQAKNISITVSSSHHHDQLEKISLVLTDDGKGFESDANMGIGLVAMRERSYSLNGEFSISSRKPHGTQIIINLPY